MPELTPFQTVGPFFALLPLEGVNVAAGPDVPGRRVVISGTVRDGQGSAVPDALIETWQADSEGRLDSAGFSGLARALTDAAGHFEIHTIVPGSIADPEGQTQAPHLLVGILARGILTRLITRVYFPDATTGADPILSLVPESRRSTLLARETDPDQYRFDIVLQGEGETVFFDL